MRRELKNLCVVGIQWGDEGKGKIVDALTPEFDVVVRYQGGANAGHTVKIGEREFVFHLVPSGILQKGKICAIGNGVVIDPCALIQELDQLRKGGIDNESSLYISDRAHVVLPYHKVLDAAREERSGEGKIGTTLRGIGPCYEDKAARQGIRVVDWVDPDRFRSLVDRNLERKNLELVKVFGREPLSASAIYKEYGAYADRLRPRVCDVSRLLHEKHREGCRILFEGAQGSLLDIDLGTYPYVTSSNTSFLGVGTGSGFSPRRVDTVLGVTKAYSTRVGEGPFPTELDDSTGSLLRQVGSEFGATTGRPRRCGWLDMAAIRHAIEFGDIDALAVTKLDVLDRIEEIKVSTGYVEAGKALDVFPAGTTQGVEPRYVVLPGWKEDTSSCRSWQDLPAEAKRYLQFIADQSGCPIAMISVGKDRGAIIHLTPWLAPSSKEGLRRG
jgi:adenylosuccinate synthase